MFLRNWSQKTFAFQGKQNLDISLVSSFLNFKLNNKYSEV